MKRWTIALLVLMFFMGVPMAVMAMSHEGHAGHEQDKSEKMMHKGHEMEGHGDMKHEDHDEHKGHAGMSMAGGMIVIGTQESDGVKGMAHLKDVSEAMDKMGMKATHHFMVAFVDEKTGLQIEEGTVALKITDPDGNVSEAVKLMGMQGHFGADVIVEKKGVYHFKLGTKLADGVKRKFHFHQIIK
jgi:hypothetical protein